MTATDSPTSVTSTMNPRIQNKARIQNLIRRVKTEDQGEYSPSDDSEATMIKAKAAMNSRRTSSMTSIEEGQRDLARRTKSSDMEGSGRSESRRTRTHARRTKSTDGSIQPSLGKKRGGVKPLPPRCKSSDEASKERIKEGRAPTRRTKTSDGSMDASKGRIKAKRSSSKGEYVAGAMCQMDSHDMIAALEHMAQNDNEVAFDAFQKLRNEERESDPSERDGGRIR